MSLIHKSSISPQPSQRYDFNTLDLITLIDSQPPLDQSDQTYQKLYESCHQTLYITLHQTDILK